MSDLPPTSQQQEPRPLAAPSEVNIGGEAKKIGGLSESEIISLSSLISGLIERVVVPERESPRVESHRLWQETVASIAGTLMKLAGFVVIVLALSKSATTLDKANSTPEAKKLAESTIVLILGAITGFSVGKSQK